MNGKPIDEIFNLPDEYVTEYYNEYKDLIFAACRQQFEEFRKYHVDEYEAMPNPNPKVIGRMLGMMLYADDWKTLAMAMEICKDHEERDAIWGKLHGVD